MELFPIKNLDFILNNRTVYEFEVFLNNMFLYTNFLIVTILYNNFLNQLILRKYFPMYVKEIVHLIDQDN